MRWWKRRRDRLAGAAREFDAALRQALLAVLDHDFPQAESLLADAARLDSEAPEPYLALARLYRTRGEIGRAIRIHQNLLLRGDLDPGSRFQALLGLAGDFRQGGFLRRAIAAYEEVLAQQPDHPGALRALVRLLADARDHERALELARRLQKLEGRESEPSEAELWVECAEAARAEGRTQDARRALRHALGRDSACARAWIELGQLEAERNRPKQALAAWKRVPALDRRKGPLVYEPLEATFAALGRARDHEKFLRGLLEDQPDDPAARLALARTLAARGETDEALGEVRRVLERDPECIEAHRVLGRMLLAEPREVEALKAYAEVLDVLERKLPSQAREILE